MSPASAPNLGTGARPLGVGHPGSFQRGNRGAASAAAKSVGPGLKGALPIKVVLMVSGDGNRRRDGVTQLRSSVEGPITLAARAAIAGLWAQVLPDQGRIRGDSDPDNVHRMRVAVRRLRTILRVVDPVLAPGTAGAWARELRRFGTLLGQVRDADVQIVAVMRWRTRVEGVGAQTWDGIVDAISNGRRQTHDELVAALESPWRAHLASLSRSCLESTEVGSGAAADEEGIRAQVCVLVHKCRRALRRVTLKSTVERAHRLRITIKCLRYALELLHDLTGGGWRKEIRGLVGVQDDLGGLLEAIHVGRAATDLRVAATAEHPDFDYPLGIMIGFGRAYEAELPALASRAVARTELKSLLDRISRHLERK